jgi:putative ABC transport system substrate-binding protein
MHASPCAPSQPRHEKSFHRGGNHEIMCFLRLSEALIEAGRTPHELKILRSSPAGKDRMRFDQLKRREFISLLMSGAAATRSFAVHAQQLTKSYRIAIVHPSASIADMSESGSNPYYSALFKQLRRFGYIEGTNLVVARYSGEGREERYPELCQAVVRTNPDVIVATASRIVLSFKAATETIPVVASMADPVAFNIVASLARPGGNITGISVEAGLDIWGKRLQVLREAVPAASKVAFLASRGVWNLPQVTALREAAQQLSMSLVGPPIEGPIQEEEYRHVFDAMVQQNVDGVIIGDQAEHVTYRQLILNLTDNAQLPTVFPYREFFDIGAAISYGPSLVDVYRRLANYIDQILKGARPGELPIYLASKFELLINLKPAKNMGLRIPPSLLVRADEVIE